MGNQSTVHPPTPCLSTITKSCIREKPNLSTDADSSTDTFFPLASFKGLIAFCYRIFPPLYLFCPCCRRQSTVHPLTPGSSTIQTSHIWSHLISRPMCIVAPILFFPLASLKGLIGIGFFFGGGMVDQ